MAYLEVNDLSVDYLSKDKSTMFRLFSQAESFTAVNNVSFSIDEGQTLGIVGESGSGKSSLVRGLLGLVPTSSGNIMVNGTEVISIAASLNAQLVFQDPLASLDPRFTIARCITEPLELSGCPKDEIQARLYEMMDKVGLDRALANRYPHEFSGGQCQRVGIARALIAQPQILICDEPVSALDVSIRAQILNLLKQVQNDYNLTMIFIAHDIGVVKLMSHNILVMYQGQVVEHGETELLYTQAQHPYTQQLIQSQLQADPVLARKQLLNKNVSSKQL